MERFYQIGGKIVNVCGNDLSAALDAMPCMAPFRAEGPSTDRFCQFVETEEEVPVLENTIYRLTDLDTTFLFSKTADGYCLQQFMDDGQRLDLWSHRDSHHLKVKGDWEHRMTRYALWLGYGMQGLHDGRLMPHGSCIVSHGEAILFLGESGTGKSTHTRLWGEHIAGARLLNDDGPVIRVEEDGAVWIYGSPWSGKTPCYRAERYPLKACVRLSQAPYNRMTKLPVLHAYAALHPSFPPAFAYDHYLYDHQSNLIGKLLSVVPCYHLACLPNADAALLSYHTLFG